MEDRAILVGDAAGYVTKCSGEGISFAAKSGRMSPPQMFSNKGKGSNMNEKGNKFGLFALLERDSLQVR